MSEKAVYQTNTTYAEGVADRKATPTNYIFSEGSFEALVEAVCQVVNPAATWDEDNEQMAKNTVQHCRYHGFEVASLLMVGVLHGSGEESAHYRKLRAARNRYLAPRKVNDE